MPSVLAEDVDIEYDMRVDLAIEIHKFRPAKTQVNAAIEQVSNALPAGEREAFRIAMSQVLNYNVIEEISINAMVETYTQAELRAMFEYYAKPEARSASDKYSEYASRVQPEIVKIIDKAMMRMRTGGN
jgi:hypothetical protein